MFWWSDNRCPPTRQPELHTLTPSAPQVWQMSVILIWLARIESCRPAVRPCSPHGWTPASRLWAAPRRGLCAGMAYHRVMFRSDTHLLQWLVSVPPSTGPLNASIRCCNLPLLPCHVNKVSKEGDFFFFNHLPVCAESCRTTESSCCGPKFWGLFVPLSIQEHDWASQSVVASFLCRVYLCLRLPRGEYWGGWWVGRRV